MKKGIDFIGIGVGAAIIRDGKLLIQKRSQNARNEKGKWEIPGGGVEYGETQEEALKREVKEETGVEIELIELLNASNHITNEPHEHWIALVYICRIIKGDPVILEPDKCDELGWFDLDQVQKLDLAPITREDVAILKKRYPEGLPTNF